MAFPAVVADNARDHHDALMQSGRIFNMPDDWVDPSSLPSFNVEILGDQNSITTEIGIHNPEADRSADLSNLDDPTRIERAGEFTSQENIGANEELNALGNRELFQENINMLVQTGVIDPSEMFRTPDQAAKSILNVMAPLSKEYGLEVSGNILKNPGGYSYTIPKIGDAISARPQYRNEIAYHTHPSGGLFFSNSLANAGGGNDVLWVQTNKKALYLGVQTPRGVSIGVCHPSNCDESPVPTSPSRTIQGTPDRRPL